MLEIPPFIVAGIRSGYGAALPGTTATGAATTGLSNQKNMLPYYPFLKVDGLVLMLQVFTILILIPIVDCCLIQST